MSVFLLSLIDKSIGGAMIKLSQLPLRFLLLSYNHQEILAGLVEKILKTYIRFFQCVQIIPSEYNYSQNGIVKMFDLLNINSDNLDHIERKLINLIETPITNFAIPVNIHLYQSGQLFWYTGIGVLESTGHSAAFFLHRFSISTASIDYSPSSLHYLDNILNSDNLIRSVSPRKVAADYGKNYNHFQRDCKEYFGDTFHQMHNKMKMLAVLADIMFTDYSFKEVAYRNDFFNYNSMYILFCRKYKFPIDSIPRLLTEF
ncbi:hypothetical protein [Chryseobacterium sp. ISL-6]|uniref:helix-turn-helix domain-containing protein n=1 Tax=Chryseobacterium sp. ISL-6 TaxID=2819143 RepID=UPI001BE88986|nr:hypothetical protein [Chryseobacterium sp. ISL-6]MBT2621913.1 helix-turn-helix transcriptional regulator [Chryseobacterium sp. ISL-6]